MDSEKQIHSEDLDTEEDEEEYVENEPYLGPAWAVVMAILYVLLEAFPAEKYTALWWFQVYVICLVIAVTIFTLVKRHQFYRAERLRLKRQKDERQKDGGEAE